jgi:hypothetical protein
MATTKRSKGGRATASRTKTTVRPRAPGGKAKATPKKKVAVRAVKKAKPAAKAKAAPAKRPTPARAVSPRGAAAKSTRATAKPVRHAGAESPEIVALKARFQRERNGLEKRLTEAVREIGLLRHQELRAMQFERQIVERDVTIGRLQTQLGELQRRPVDPVPAHEREVQQTLALGAPARQQDGSARDLDEFEDDRLADDGDLVTDEE